MLLLVEALYNDREENITARPKVIRRQAEGFLDNLTGFCLQIDIHARHNVQGGLPFYEKLWWFITRM